MEGRTERGRQLLRASRVAEMSDSKHHKFAMASVQACKRASVNIRVSLLGLIFCIDLFGLWLFPLPSCLPSPHSPKKRKIASGVPASTFLPWRFGSQSGPQAHLGQQRPVLSFSFWHFGGPFGGPSLTVILAFSSFSSFFFLCDLPLSYLVFLILFSFFAQQAGTFPAFSFAPAYHRSPTGSPRLVFVVSTSRGV